jgi:E3 ubiquitin-protein ligase makorin
VVVEEVAGSSWPGTSPTTTPGFKTQLCTYFAAGACKHGIMCSFAHGAAELQGRVQASGSGKAAPPPTGHKTRLCRNFLAAGGCTFGAKCTFAHGASDRASPSAV